MGNASHIVPVRRNQHDRNDITVIILAANIGYGMKSYGPKSLLNINDKETILEYQINILQTTFPSCEIILVVGFQADRIIKKCPPGIRIIENQLYETTNEVEQIRLALNSTLTDNVIIIKDDIVFNQETLKTITKNKSCIIYDSGNQMDNNNVGVTVVNGYATIFSYDIETKWCHILYLAKKEMEVLKSICNKRNKERLYLFEILNVLLKRISRIKAIKPQGMEVTKIDTSKNLLMVQNENINI